MDNLDVELEFELTLHFDLIREEPMTRHYPGHPGSIDINSISILGVEVCKNLCNALMAHYEDVFIDEIRDKVINDERGLRVGYTGIYYKYKNKGETYV